jgi:cell division protein FtsL
MLISGEHIHLCLSIVSPRTNFISVHSGAAYEVQQRVNEAEERILEQDWIVGLLQKEVEELQEGASQKQEAKLMLSLGRM